MIDFQFVAKKEASIDEIHDAIKYAASTELKDILVTNDEPLVSTDFNHSSASSIFDLTQTQVMGGKLCRILAWYANEWGYSCRTADLASYIARQGV